MPDFIDAAGALAVVEHHAIVPRNPAERDRLFAALAALHRLAAGGVGGATYSRE
ncbi:hypothetical protein [Streptomyces sp. NPDC054804]